MIRFVMQYRAFVTVLLIGLLSLGVAGYLTTPRFEDPPMVSEACAITILYPGATPQELEDEIVDDLEEDLFGMEEVEEVEARLFSGGVFLLAEFHEGQDFEDAYDRLDAKIQSHAQEFPPGVRKVETLHWKTNDVVVLQFALLSNHLNHHRLRLRAKELKERLQVVPGVYAVKLYGEQTQEVRVSVDPDRLSMWRIPLLGVVQAITKEDEDHPGGRIQSSERELFVETTGEFEDLEDIQDTVVAVREGRTIRVRDVATVAFCDQDPSYRARYNGRPCLFLTVKMRFGINALEVIPRAKETAEEFGIRHAEELQVETVFDQGVHIAKRVTNFNWNLLFGAAIVNALICLLMGLRPSLVVSASLPASVVIGLAFLPWMNLGVQQIVIAGLIICLGMLVDNSIVVVEMIVQRRLGGEPIGTAIVNGVQSVTGAITSSTLTTIAAFMPIMVLPGGAGRFTRGIPVMVILTLLASLLVALTLIPLVSQYAFRSVRSIRLAPVARLLEKGVVPYLYLPALEWTLRHRAVFLLWMVSLWVCGMILFPHIGYQFFPHAEKPFLVAHLRMPDGTNLDATEAAALELEKLLLDCPEAISVATNIGHSNPTVYYNLPLTPDDAAYAMFLVHTDARLKTTDVDALAERLRQKTAGWGEREVQVQTIQQGPVVDADVIVRLRGTTWEDLDAQIREVEKRVRDVPQVMNVTRQLRRGAADLELAINDEKAHKLALSSSQIGLTVRTALVGTPATTYREGGETYPVVVRLPSSGRHEVSVLDRVYIPVWAADGVVANAGAAPTHEIPLGQVVTPRLKGKWTQLQHKDTERVAEVHADAVPGVTTDEATAAVAAAVAGMRFPPDIRMSLAGENVERDESFGDMGRGALIGIVMIFAILVWQFRCVIQPLIVFSSMVLAVSGGTLALYLSGEQFGFMAFMGTASLAGIVVNDAIVLVDQINQDRRAGLDRASAIRASARSRLLPVLLTTVTTVGGLLPLATMGGLMYAGMAWVLIGGLSSATILTLFVVPVLYSLLIRENG